MDYGQSITPEEFLQFLGAPWGAQMVYYRGYLARDRSRTHAPRRLSPADTERIGLVSGMAARSAAEGFVALVQRRHGPGDYSYIAERLPAAAGSGVVLAVARIVRGYDGRIGAVSSGTVSRGRS